MTDADQTIAKRNWVADFAQGCGLRILLLIAMMAGFYLLLCLRLPFPRLVLLAKGAEVAGPISGLFMWCAALYLLYARQNEKDLALLARGLQHGERALVIGSVKPEGPLLTAPFSGETCVGYHYRAIRFRGSGKSKAVWSDWEGYALAPCAIRSALGDVRVLANPDKDLFSGLPDSTLADTAYERAGAYLKATDFGEMREGIAGSFSELRTVKGPGDFRVDTRLKDVAEDLRQCRLREKIIRPGATVHMVGIYTGPDNGLVMDPHIMNTPFRIMPGSEETLRSKTLTRLRVAAVCATVSLAIVMYYFLLYAPSHPGLLH